MNSTNIQTVKINIGSNMYSRFADLPNTVPHVLAEFVDNALQSYYDNKDELHGIENDYRLRISIDIEWDEDANSNKAKRIIISDNAAGINSDKYLSAFMPAKTPDNNTGLNEFGMGLKTAALWLGEVWEVKTKALGEPIERTFNFNLNEVTANELVELPVETTEKNINEHYTIVTITDSTKNAPSRRSVDRIKTDLASIYRKSLRNDEMQLFVCGEKLSFEEYNVLVAPPANNLQADPITWKKDIDFSFLQYKAKGFIGLLRDIDNTKNGFALLRRGRVIVGAEVDGRYFPRMSGSSGTFRYKRLFGELELEGFDVSFNKNDIQDKENLEALMDALRDEIRTPEFDIFNQADDYRLNETQKAISKLVKKHDTKSKKDIRPIVVNTKKITQPKSESSNIPQQNLDVPEMVIGKTEDEYSIDDKKYKLNVEFITTGNDLFIIDALQKHNGIITCKINTEHIFFKHFGKPSESVIAIIKTVAISKFAAKECGNDSTAELLDFFNEFIRQTKV